VADQHAVAELLATLGRAVDASFVQVERRLAAGGALVWERDEKVLDVTERAELVRRGQAAILGAGPSGADPPVAVVDDPPWYIAAVSLHGSSLDGDALVVGRADGTAFTASDLDVLTAFGRLVPVALQEAAITSPLDDLVTHLATELMPVSASTLEASLRQLVRVMAEFFGVSTAFLRRNDHVRGVSVLVAEWPPRENVPDPDPLAVVPFEGPGSDPIFALARDLTEPFILRPSGGSDQYQDRVHDASGAPPVSLATVPILRDGATTGVLGFVNFGDRVWTGAEINAQRAIASLLSQLEGRVEAEERLARSAYRDELTGLPNRRSLLELLHQRLSADAGPVTLAFADVDRLKAVNDTLGHGVGDALLRGVAARLHAALDRDDFVARLGGDEFVLVFGGQPADPLAVMEAVVSAVTKEPLRFDSVTLPVAMSTGIAIGRPGEVSPSDLVHRADIALLEAKRDAAGQVVLFDDAMLITSEIRHEINRHLPDAVESGAMEAHYLAEVDLRDGTLLAFEALARWHHPTLGLVQPSVFIPVAEESPRRIAEIGEWILDEACGLLAEWRRRFGRRDLVMRVNVSPVQLMTADVTTVVSRVLSSHGLVGADLCLEVAESTLLRQIDRVIDALHGIREIGVRIALDDFGTGYSSLSQLKWLPVDILKIDRQFITDLGRNEGDHAIVESTILLARNFGLTVVAEGVETVEAARELVRLGCIHGAGHLIHAAAPAQAVESMVERMSVPFEGAVSVPEASHGGVRGTSDR